MYVCFLLHDAPDGSCFGPLDADVTSLLRQDYNDYYRCRRQLARLPGRTLNGRLISCLPLLESGRCPDSRNVTLSGKAQPSHMPQPYSRAVYRFEKHRPPSTRPSLGLQDLRAALFWQNCTLLASRLRGAKARRGSSLTPRRGKTTSIPSTRLTRSCLRWEQNRIRMALPLRTDQSTAAEI